MGGGRGESGQREEEEEEGRREDVGEGSNLLCGSGPVMQLQD